MPFEASTIIPATNTQGEKAANTQQVEKAETNEETPDPNAPKPPGTGNSLVGLATQVASVTAGGIAHQIGLAAKAIAKMINPAAVAAAEAMEKKLAAGGDISAIPGMPAIPAIPGMPGANVPAAPAASPAAPAAAPQAGGARIKKTKYKEPEDALSTEAQLMGATVIALIAGGSLKGLVDYLMPE